MKNIEKFISKHKKGCIIGLIAVVAIVIIFFIIFFIVPSFGNNNYGHRLDGIESHKISNSVVNDIKDNVESQEGVTKVTYHREGRILNFTINVEGSVAPDKAKEYANLVIDGISKKNLKYYDVQIYLDSDDNTKDYPTAGYKHKSSDSISWGNVGETSE